MASNQPEDTHVFKMLSPPDLCCAAEFLHLSETNKQTNKGCFALWRWSLARDFNKPLLPPFASLCVYVCVCDYLVWNQVHAVCLHDPVHHSTHLESCVWIRAVTGIRSASLLSLDFLPLSLSMINEHSVTAALTFTPPSLVPTRRFKPCGAQVAPGPVNPVSQRSPVCRHLIRRWVLWEEQRKRQTCRENL